MEMNVGSATSTYAGYQSSAVAKTDSSAKTEETKASESEGVVYERVQNRRRRQLILLTR